MVKLLSVEVFPKPIGGDLGHVLVEDLVVLGLWLDSVLKIFSTLNVSIILREGKVNVINEQLVSNVFVEHRMLIPQSILFSGLQYEENFVFYSSGSIKIGSHIVCTWKWHHNQ